MPYSFWIRSSTVSSREIPCPVMGGVDGLETEGERCGGGVRGLAAMERPGVGGGEAERVGDCDGDGLTGVDGRVTERDGE